MDRRALTAFAVADKVVIVEEEATTPPVRDAPEGRRLSLAETLNQAGVLAGSAGVWPGRLRNWTSDSNPATCC